MPYDPNYFQVNKGRFNFYGARQRDKLKLEMVAAYGGACSRCGMDNPFALCLDHINDDAHIEKELFGRWGRGGDKLYWKLKREGWPKDRFQLLCFNCNAIKEHTRRRELMGDPEKVDRLRSQAGSKPPSHNSSGFRGVFWNSQKGKWAARIMREYKNIHLGFFDDIRDAAKAYRAAAVAQWGIEANPLSDGEIERIASKSKPALVIDPSLDLGI